MRHVDAIADVSKMQQTTIFASFGGHKGPRRVEARQQAQAVALPSATKQRRTLLAYRAIDTASSQRLPVHVDACPSHPPYPLVGTQRPPPDPKT
ncbi:hypothetical protein [Paraburkholderia haematera]|uniref:hypothetical protein n=1 Tax=Paraburkholderia haematera TaxID=2793077 RepID=UPI001B8ABE7F|nr:hypothetical protein [Paraburkholderia haematera]